MKFDYNCNNCGKMNVIVMHELINGDSYCLSCHSQLLISDGESINQRNSLDLIYQLGKKK